MVFTVFLLGLGLKKPYQLPPIFVHEEFLERNLGSAIVFKTKNGIKSLIELPFLGSLQ